MVNKSAWFAVTLPAGISRTTVRGFIASISRSRYRLKAIAAFRASTIQQSIRINCSQVKPSLVVLTARKKPIIAKGRAKMLWANRTNEKYFFIQYQANDQEDLKFLLISSIAVKISSQPCLVSAEVRNS